MLNPTFWLRFAPKSCFPAIALPLALVLGLSVTGRAIAAPEATVGPAIDPGIGPSLSPSGEGLAPQPSPDATGLPNATGLMDQVTSVSELSDVQPTDWAFQALQLLVERYGCIAGYPDGTFKGNQAMTRFEFAAGVYACLTRMNEILETTVAGYVKKEDLTSLRKLQETFAAELALLRGRVDTLEARTSELEANQFSTTTKLEGSVIFSLQGGSFDNHDSNAENVTFSQRTRLIFNTSFTGKDTLVTRLESNNVQDPLNDRTGLGSLSYGGGEDSQIRLSYLGYFFPIGDKGQMVVATNGVDLDDIHEVNNPYLYGDGSGALSRFADRSPILRQPADAGVGFKWQFNDTVGLALGYTAGNAASPASGNGVFNGSYSAHASLNFSGGEGRFGANLLYAHSYYSSRDFRNGDEIGLLGEVGTARTYDTFGGNSTITDNVGLQAFYQFTPHFGVNGWVGYTKAQDATSSDEADLWTWAVALNFPDLFKEGNLGAIVVGQPPTITSGRGVPEDDNTPIHLELLYKLAINDHISITPGAIAIFNADNNDNAYVGVVRTEFKF